ncbi:4-amino-4-deoxy-L-arabinose transferase-like glycosyltransferase [Microbacterium endophyticum]|uniref:4-amino-4-deoxy-L-arabinose transferase-like glycosyltransferase n=1 Tax=Microbacterium endophyticum TaxID=1526412 RepID=A0A7W4V4F4_9MICO|nr:DUF2142 domain-containing protein [Microbacterium endophyticum]MBB2976339.1 4-amino-4-deoxy-L-arabinose transferase-like glycosyltransferase [Microbacterium endophyticum]NIK35219.1 4-amino-4-deoxy-L-arabinose transferase-like glycosyltransferase [Microbacterium endophyticum]
MRSSFRAGGSRELSESRQAEPTERAPLLVWVLTAALVFICATWSILTPPLLAPDETSHLSSVLRVADDLSWPDPGEARIPEYVTMLGEERQLAPEDRSVLSDLAAQHPDASDRLDQMTQHPPLYYVIAAGVVKIFGAEDWRWDQAALLVRLLGAILAAPLVWLAWSATRTLTRSRKAGILAAMAIFLVPGLAQMLGVANNDTFAILVGSIVAWLSIKILCGDRRRSVLLGLGVAFGLAGLAKGTLLAYGILVVLVLLFGAGHPRAWPQRLWQTAWPLLVSLVFGQWWWIRNLVLFGTLQPYGYLLSDTTWAPGTGPSIGDFIDEMWRVTPATFWGWFGRVNAPLPQILVDFATVTCIVLVLTGMLRRKKTLRTAAILVSPILISAVLMLRVSWGAYAETTAYRGMHGRYFYPFIVLVLALAALALSNIVRERSARTALALGTIAASVAMAFFGLAVSGIYFYGDDLWAQWRSALTKWIFHSSSLPAGTTTVIAGLACALLITGAVMSVRAILVSPEDREQRELAG